MLVKGAPGSLCCICLSRHRGSGYMLEHFKCWPRVHMGPILVINEPVDALVLRCQGINRYNAENKDVTYVIFLWQLIIFKMFPRTRRHYSRAGSIERPTSICGPQRDRVYGMIIKYNIAHVVHPSATGLSLCYYWRNMAAYLRCPSTLTADDPVIRQSDCFWKQWNVSLQGNMHV